MVNCTLNDVNFVVSGNIRIEKSVTLDPGADVDINNAGYSGYVNLTILESSFYSFGIGDYTCSAQWNITIINSTFMGSGLAGSIFFSVCANVFYGMHIVNVSVLSSFRGIQLELSATNGNVILSVLSSTFTDNYGNAIKCVLTTHSTVGYTSLLISDTKFVNNHGLTAMAIDFMPLVDLSADTFTFNNVNFTHNFLSSSTGTLSITPTLSYIVVNMTNVNFITNKYFKEIPRDKTAAVYIKIPVADSKNLYNTLIFDHCNFVNKSSMEHIPHAQNAVL